MNPTAVAVAAAGAVACFGCVGQPDATPDAAIPRDGAAAPDAGDADGGRDDAAAPPAPITIAIISDLNGSYGSVDYGSAVHAAVARLVELEPDVVLSAGDMVAGQQSGLDYDAMWAGFHDAVSNPLAAAHIPFAVAPGNHDASGYPSFVQERAVYDAQWSARVPAVDFVDASHYPFRYSFAMGAALLIALDDTKVGALDAEQMSWLDEQLAAGADYPVKIVYGHVPLYPVAQGRETEVIGDTDLEELLVARGVTAFIAGHHHAYYPGRRGALRLVTASCLGSGPRALIGENTVSGRSFILVRVEDGRVSSLDAYGGSDFEQVVARATLPESIGAGAELIVRDDL